MIRALRDYIIDQNKEILESAMAQLKKSLDFDSTAIDHLHLALYSFQVSWFFIVCSYMSKDPLHSKNKHSETSGDDKDEAKLLNHKNVVRLG